MYRIVSSIPFEIFVLIFLLLIGGSVFCMFDIQKSHPNHPVIWVFPFSIFMSIVLIIDKCVFEFSKNSQLQKILDKMTIVAVILFFISFIITFIIACKKNYVDKEKLKNIIPLFICCGIVILICCFSIYLRNH